MCGGREQPASLEAGGGRLAERSLGRAPPRRESSRPSQHGLVLFWLSSGAFLTVAPRQVRCHTPRLEKRSRRRSLAARDCLPSRAPALPALSCPQLETGERALNTALLPFSCLQQAPSSPRWGTSRCSRRAPTSGAFAWRGGRAVRDAYEEETLGGCWSGEPAGAEQQLDQRGAARRGREGARRSAAAIARSLALPPRQLQAAP